MRRLAAIALPLLAMLALAGCGTQQLSRAFSVGTRGCTDLWTGAAWDHDWSDPINWSTHRVPTLEDTACIRPGSLVLIRRKLTIGSVINEGSLCVQHRGVRAEGAVQQGTPFGRRQMQPGPDASADAVCPSSGGAALAGSR